MPMDRSLYPPNWNEIAQRVKDAAGWRCQECGKECRRPKEDLGDFIIRTSGGIHCSEDFERLHHPQKWTLTVAHLDHQPQNCEIANLRALCSSCHCRYDLSQMPRKKFLKRERLGQLTLFESI